MPTTVQNVIDRAIDRSGLNFSGMASDPALIARISAGQKFLFKSAGIIDPEYFGKSGDTTTRTLNSQTWDLNVSPGDVGLVTKAEVKTITGAVSGVSVGTRVNLVDLRFPDLGVSPRAYVRGRNIVPHSTELGTNDTNMVTVLTIYYSESPATVTTATVNLRLPDEWTQLLVLELAKYLAIRDQRLEEVQPLDAEYQELFQRFTQEVAAYRHGVQRPLAAVPAIPLTAPQR